MEGRVAVPRANRFRTASRHTRIVESCEWLARVNKRQGFAQAQNPWYRVQKPAGQRRAAVPYVEQPVKVVKRLGHVQGILEFGPGDRPTRDLPVMQGPLVKKTGAEIVLPFEMQRPCRILGGVETKQRVSGTATEVAGKAPGGGHGRC
jgi:hypothetical protein